MKAAKTIAILMALPLLLTCELFSGPYDRENPKDPLNPNYAGWFGIRTVDPTNNVGMYPSMKVSGANVFISYFDATKGQVRFATSADSGISWTTAQVGNSANTAGNPSAIAIRPKASTFDISLIYHDWINLRAKKSSDAGATWVDATTQPDVAGTVLQDCSLAAGTGADDTYYASYYVQGAVGGKLWFAKSVVGGANWSAGVFVDNNPTEDVGKFSSIAVQGTAVFIAYLNSTTGKIVMTNSITGGTTFQMPPVFVGSTSATTLGGTAVAATDGTNVYVVYFDGTYLSFAKSSDGGGSFSTPASISTGGGISPSIAVSAGKIYVSHFHATSGDLLFSRSDDFGATWITPPLVVDT
ncbi:MAG: sialidase family protein, partial [Spirochaetes bacterium]|nr:sialidase family protein [Spirochaetota bacterium]